MSFNFGKYKVEQQTIVLKPSKTKKVKSKHIPQPATPPSKSSTKSVAIYVPDKKVDLEEFIAEHLDIIKAVNNKFSGLIVRYDQRNIHVKVFSVLNNAFNDPEIFKILHQKGLLEKTKYTGQWKIK